MSTLSITARLSGLIPENFRLSTLYSKFFLLTVGMSVALVSILFVINDFANQSFARNQIATDLRIAQRVAMQSLANDKDQLTQAASVLASDFGLREAIGSHDVDTIVSALSNHAARIKAPIAVITDLDGKVLASTQQTIAPGDISPGKSLKFLSRLQGSKQSSDVNPWIVVDGHATLIVTAPVKAPLTIGWVVLGFPINTEKVRQLSELTGMEVAIASSVPSNNAVAGLPADWNPNLNINASTLMPLRLSDLGQQLGHALFLDRINNDIPVSTHKGSPPNLLDTVISGHEMEFDSEKYLISISPLPTDQANAQSQVALILFKSLDQALAPYLSLRFQLFLIATFGILLTIIGSRWMARTITSPIASLVKAMRGISNGDYSSKVQIHTGDEVENLADGFNTMTKAVAEREEQIRHQAFHDALTGLPNYRKLDVDGSQQLQALQRENRSAVMFKFDINRFRLINESLGYEIGNQTLLAVAKRLSTWLREADVLARQSGNEFALLLPRLDPAKAQAMFHRLHEAFEQPLEICGELIDIRFCAGCSYFPEHGKNVSELLQKAEIALFTAKRTSAEVAVYDPALEANTRNKLTLLGELKQAVKVDNQLQVFLQPKVKLGTSGISQAEALVRWDHPEHGFIPPSDFIPFAEQTGRITEVTRWMLDRVVRMLADWKDRYGWELRISVNVSIRDIQDIHFPGYVSQLLQMHKLSAEFLCLEITETGLMDDPGTALKTLSELDQMGITISIDDFGTGYSSLAYLRKMPAKELKIDRSFVNGADRNADARALLKSTVELGHSLGMSVVAEGVETEAELELLTVLGCDYVQGYLISKPQSTHAFEEWYKLNRHFLYAA